MTGSYSGSGSSVKQARYIRYYDHAAYTDGLALTIEPGYSDRIDPAEDLLGPFQGRVILQEVDLNTATPLFDIQLTSGKFKMPAGDESDIRCIVPGVQDATVCLIYETAVVSLSKCAKRNSQLAHF